MHIDTKTKYKINLIKISYKKITNFPRVINLYNNANINLFAITNSSSFAYFRISIKKHFIDEDHPLYLTLDSFDTNPTPHHNSNTDIFNDSKDHSLIVKTAHISIIMIDIESDTGWGLTTRELYTDECHSFIPVEKRTAICYDFTMMRFAVRFERSIGDVISEMW